MVTYKEHQNLTKAMKAVMANSSGSAQYIIAQLSRILKEAGETEEFDVDYAKDLKKTAKKLRKLFPEICV